MKGWYHGSQSVSEIAHIQVLSVYEKKKKKKKQKKKKTKGPK